MDGRHWGQANRETRRRVSRFGYRQWCGTSLWSEGGALGAGRGEQADSGRSRQVEALGAAVDRHPDRDLGQVAYGVGQTPGLVAEQPRGRLDEKAAVGRGVEIDLGPAVGRDHPEPARSELPDRPGRVGFDDDVDVEETAGAGADRLRVIRVDRVADQDHAFGSGRISATQHRSGVAGVAHVGADSHQPGHPGEKRLQRNVDEAAAGHHALWLHGLAHRGDDLDLDDLPRDAGRVGPGPQLRVAIGRLGIGEHLEHDTVDGQRLAYRLRALGDELALRVPERPVSETSNPAYPARPDGQLGRSAQAADSLLALTSSGRLFFARSTSASNAAGSLTASSARCLRSTSTSAAFRPWMKRL